MSGITVTANFGATGNIAVARQTDLQSGASSAYTDGATVTADITVALANDTISGDETALGLVTQIQTDFATLMSALAAGENTSHVLVSYNPTDVVSKNNLRSALAMITQVIVGAGDLS